MQLNHSLKLAMFLAASLGLASTSSAQNSTATVSTSQITSQVSSSETAKALASRMVALQNGPEMERMVLQLSSSAMQPLISKWVPKLEALPSAKQAGAIEKFNAELAKVSEKTKAIVSSQMTKSAGSILEKAYLERFTEDELKSMVEMFEAPIFRKYQALAPELGNIWIKDVIENSRDAVFAQDKVFDDAAAKIVAEKSGPSLEIETRKNVSARSAPLKSTSTKK